MLSNIVGLCGSGTAPPASRSFSRRPSTRGRTSSPSACTSPARPVRASASTTTTSCRMTPRTAFASSESVTWTRTQPTTAAPDRRSEVRGPVGAHHLQPSPRRADVHLRPVGVSTPPWKARALRQFDVLLLVQWPARDRVLIPQIAVTSDGSGAVINLFNSGETDLSIRGTLVQLRTTTRYPFDGSVRIAISPRRSGPVSAVTAHPGVRRRRSLSG